jgi:hypothetical protein
MPHRHRRRRSRLDDLTLDALALAWLVRGAWRVSRGRLPWRPAHAAGKQGKGPES